ncbi:MAG: BMP family ABC transporter substrate-binding protein [Alphaproteobacteria bacterium]|nr:BMP family ABC transporter substrate-binding protein [Alphaproteobacteria bacterium]
MITILTNNKILRCLAAFSGKFQPVKFVSLLASLAFGLFILTILADPANAKKKSAAIAQNPFKVAFIYPTKTGQDQNGLAPAEMSGFVAQHELGRMELEKSLRGRVTTQTIEDVTAGVNDESVMRDLIAQGNKVIFAADAEYGAACAKLAAEFPDIYFLQFGGHQSNGKNFASYNARDYEGSYLDGLLAGTMTKSNNLGFIANAPTPSALQAINAFLLGAQSINSYAKLQVVWLNAQNPSQNPPQKPNHNLAHDAVMALIDQDVDVLFYNIDGNSIAALAEAKMVYIFGFPSDLKKSAPNYQLTATTQNWGKYFTTTVQNIMRGHYQAQNFWGGIRHGTIKQVGLNRTVPLNLSLRYERLYNQLKAGSFNPFIGPITDVNGKIAVKADRALTDNALQKMDFRMAGIKEIDLPKPVVLPTAQPDSGDLTAQTEQAGQALDDSDVKNGDNSVKSSVGDEIKP